MPAALVGRRIDKQLKTGGGRLPVARVDADHGRKIASGAVASDGNALRLYAELMRVRRDIACGRNAIVYGRWKLRFRRKPVFDREHRAPRSVGEFPAHHVVRVEVADHPSTAMEVDQRREDLTLGRPGRLVDAQRDRSGGARDYERKTAPISGGIGEVAARVS